MNVCARALAHTCVYLWRPEDNLDFPQELSVLSLDIRSLAGSWDSLLGRVWLTSKARDLPMSTSTALVLRVTTVTPAF